MTILLLCGCTTYAERLNNEGEGTRVTHASDAEDQRPATVRVETHDPPPGCAARGFVEGSAPSLGSDSYDKSIRALQRETSRRGGNWVTIEATGQRGIYVTITRGRAFFCSNEALAAKTVTSPPVASSEPGACEPDCSPGYTCLRGRCVSACNPPCASGERCGADRICH
jgi:hypothetical protein